MQLGDAEQVCPLLLAADPRLSPRQRRLEVKLVTAVCQRVCFPECLTGGAWQRGRGRSLLVAVNGGVGGNLEEAGVKAP